MTYRSIAGIGGYLPLLRLNRKAATEALRWSGLGGQKQGRRAVASWDEDAVTLAVEAGRGCLADSEVAPQSLIFASTSAPFLERSQAALVIDALHLPPSTANMDVAGSRRCGTSALLGALRGAPGPALITAGERRPTRPGSPLQLAFGDGGAAVLVDDAGPARLCGYATISHDMIDIYASREHPTPYQAEERFIRDVAVSDILAPTILAACKAAGVTPDRIAHAAVIEPVAGCFAAVAKRIGMQAANTAAELANGAGDLGAAHPLFALGLAFAKAKPGDIILLAGFGSGCDAMLFEMTDVVPGAQACADALKHGLALADYIRFLSLSGSLDLDWGVRAEFEQKTAATVLTRYGRDILGFIGGRDSLGNVQFPKTAMPVNPALAAAEPLTDVRLADATARIVSITADRLNYCPDPPFYFGMAQFDNGARLLMEFTDSGPSGFAVGDALAMRLRIKTIDRRRGFRSYFWKAAPAARPLLED